MRRSFYACCLVLSILFSPIQGCAQQYPSVTVAVSSRKTVEKGETYYLHRVRRGETLFAIANAYGVLQKDIVAANPSALTSVQVGEELKIPVRPMGAEAGSTLETEQFIYHIATRGQTREAVAEQYNISLERLFQYNPELRYSSIDRGQVIRIPRTEGEIAEKPAVEEKFVVHRVASGETMFGISNQYGVDLNEVLRLNPTIDNRTMNIRVGQEVVIPVKPEPIAGIPLSLRDSDTIVVRHDVPADKKHIPLQLRQGEFRVALLLPLYVPENHSGLLPGDTTLTLDPYTGGYRNRAGDFWIYPPSENFLNFYQGVLLALDTLRSRGVEIDLHVYDTGRDVQRVRQVLASPEMRHMDLLIGPFYTNQVQLVSDFARQHDIYCVSPLTNNPELPEGRPSLFQVTPDRDVLLDSLVGYVARQHGAMVTLISNRNEPSSLYIRWKEKIQQRVPAPLFREISYTNETLDTDSIFDIGRNVVVSFSEDEVFVGRMIAALNRQKIELIGLSSWPSYSNVNVEYLYNLSFVTAAPFFVDYNKPSVQRFLERHRRFFRVEPVGFTSSGYNFTYLGYDIMWHFGSLLSVYGRSFGTSVHQVSSSELLTDFEFLQLRENSGFSNVGVRMLQYTPDYYLQLIR